MTRRLLSLLHVPPEPRLPAGDPSSARVFRAAPRFWTLKLLGWGARQAVTLAGLVWAVVILGQVPETVPLKSRGAERQVSTEQPLRIARTIETLAWLAWIVQLPVTFALLRLDYELRWYIVTDRAARLREGILTLREMTFTLANVQDIRIRPGPLQRLLGLADVELRTAGGSEGPAVPGEGGGGHRENLHLARFRGVDNAEAIRDLVIDRMKKARGAGLGDPDDAPIRSDHPPEGLAAAAEDLRRASAALRAAVS